MRPDQAEDEKLRTPADARDHYKLSQRAALVPSDAAACSAVATIRRHKYPHEYIGWNMEHDSPKWTSDRLDAAPVPLEILISELNKIAARETNIWAVVYPQNVEVKRGALMTETN